jgi:OTU domain-containing protein 6
MQNSVYINRQGPVASLAYCINLGSSNSSPAMETLEQMEARHRKEQRDLQSRVTQRKKSATRKTRRGVLSECEDLERQLLERQKQERAILHSDSVPGINDLLELDSGPADGSVHASMPAPMTEAAAFNDSVDELVDGLYKASVAETAGSSNAGPRKRNRQKERQARRAAEQEAATVEAEKEAAALPDWKRKERAAMLKAFKENGLIEKEIAPDGHCLFSAIADQLTEIGIPLSREGETADERDAQYRVVRKTAARYIEGHANEFAGFLDEPLHVYVQKIRDAAEWGGQVELIALAKSYSVEIRVIQDGRIDKIEPEVSSGKKAEEIWLAYYRHGYGLGEHYNSLRRTPRSIQEFD